MNTEQIEKDIEIELARLQGCAGKLFLMASDLKNEPKEVPVSEIASLFTMAADISALYIHTAMELLHAEENQDDDDWDEDDPCAAAEGDCDQCENRSDCCDDEIEEDEEDCSNCPDFEKESCPHFEKDPNDHN